MADAQPSEEGYTNEMAAKAKSAAKQVLKEDLLGSKQWAGSKIGYLTGFSPIKKNVTSVFSMGMSGASRSMGLFRSFISDRDAGLPVVDGTLAARERFEAASELYGKGEEDLRAMLLNSRRAFNLYAVIAVVLVLIGVLSFRVGPLAAEPFGFSAIMIRFGLLPILFALMLRWGYLNWIVRRRSLDGLWAYVTSGAVFPADDFED